MLLTVAQGGGKWPFQNVLGGEFIRDGEFKHRFVFVMRRRWVDLRTSIDQRMLGLLQNKSHGPPFSDIQSVYDLILQASCYLEVMHDIGVLHRDITASNLLLCDPSIKVYSAVVIDYKCSLGITGTGFWRAPEILEQVQKRVSSSELVFTEKADIYSLGMMCYEILTGCISCEGHPQSDFSILLRGERPKLPPNLDPRVKALINDCWQHDPQVRPTSSEFNDRLCKIWSSL